MPKNDDIHSYNIATTQDTKKFLSTHKFEYGVDGVNLEFVLMHMLGVPTAMITGHEEITSKNGRRLFAEFSVASTVQIYPCDHMMHFHDWSMDADERYHSEDGVRRRDVLVELHCPVLKRVALFHGN